MNPSIPSRSPVSTDVPRCPRQFLHRFTLHPPPITLRPSSTLRYLRCLVCSISASSQYSDQHAMLVSCREECCPLHEALTSYRRLLPPARAQGIGTSCGFDRLSQGSLGSRFPEETHAPIDTPRFR